MFGSWLRDSLQWSNAYANPATVLSPIVSHVTSRQQGDNCIIAWGLFYTDPEAGDFIFPAHF